MTSALACHLSEDKLSRSYQLTVNLSLSKPRKLIGGVEVHLHLFLTSALDGTDWSTSRVGRFISRKNAINHWTGGWVGHITGLDLLEKIKISCLYGIRTPDNQTPSLLSVTGHFQRLYTTVYNSRSRLWPFGCGDEGTHFSLPGIETCSLVV